MKFRVFRYRIGTSASRGDWRIFTPHDWMYDMTDEEIIEYLIDREDHNMSWSEHYRGCYVEKIETPGVILSHLSKRIGSLEREMERLTIYLGELREEWLGFYNEIEWNEGWIGG